MTLCCIERAASFVLHHVSRKTCLIAVACHRCDLLIVRPHHRADPEALLHGRSTIEEIYAVHPRWYYWNCAYSSRNGISGSFSIEATCSNISKAGLTLSTPMYRRNLDIYRSHVYVSVSDPLTRRKPWGPATSDTVSTLIIPRETCWYLSNSRRIFLYLLNTCEYVIRISDERRIIYPIYLNFYKKMKSSMFIHNLVTHL